MHVILVPDGIGTKKVTKSSSRESLVQFKITTYRRSYNIRAITKGDCLETNNATMEIGKQHKHAKQKESRCSTGAP